MRFAFGWQAAYLAAAAPLGIGPLTSWASVRDGRLVVRFGPWRLRTTVDDVAEVAPTGPYAFHRTAGPPHLGWTDAGLAFASNGRSGLRLGFHEAVGGIRADGARAPPRADGDARRPRRLPRDAR